MLPSTAKRRMPAPVPECLPRRGPPPGGGKIMRDQPPHSKRMTAQTQTKWRTTVRLGFALLLACFLGAETARAQNPIGTWLVADGTTHIRIVNCSDSLWGIVAWTRSPDGRDVNNPDPALRTRPTLGIPVLLHMRPAKQAGNWEGEVYNAKDGRTYDATITLRSADTLHIEGCVLGILCGGEDWQRVQSAKTNTTRSLPVSHSTKSICSRISAGPRRP
jgi:uncharacterized protein (DUF2147 family)